MKTKTKVEFVNRLLSFSISHEVEEKYCGIYDQMAAGENISAEDLEKRAESIAFVGHMFGNRLLKTETELRKAGRTAVLCEIPVNPHANLLGLHVLRHYEAGQDDLSRLFTIRVYREPAKNGTPFLSLNDVLAQIPKPLADRVAAFALCLDDNYVEDGYKHLAEAYEFKIELFTRRKPAAAE